MKWGRRRMDVEGAQHLYAWLPVEEETPSPEGFIAITSQDASRYYSTQGTYGNWATGMPWTGSISGNGLWIANPNINSQEPYDKEWEGELSCQRLDHCG